jgi:hypothetical protein
LNGELNLPNLVSDSKYPKKEGLPHAETFEYFFFPQFFPYLFLYLIIRKKKKKKKIKT